MIRTLIGRQIDSAEKAMHASMDYLRHILRVSLADFFRVYRLTKLINIRRTVPPAPFHVARLVAAMNEDCGGCVQIEVSLAQRDGLSADILRSVVGRRPSELPEELGDVYLFTECVVQNSGEMEELRGKIRQRYGEAGLIDLAMAISLARTMPTLKRGLGYASTCDVKGIRYETNAP